MVWVMVYGREGFNSTQEHPNTMISMQHLVPEKIITCFKTVAELRPLNSVTVLKHTRNFGVPNGLLDSSNTHVQGETLWWLGSFEAILWVEFYTVSNGQNQPLPQPSCGFVTTPRNLLHFLPKVEELTWMRFSFQLIWSEFYNSKFLHKLTDKFLVF